MLMRDDSSAQVSCTVPHADLLPICLSPCPSVQLRKAVMDHISDSFLETNVPLLVLIEAAKSGNEKEVKEYAQVFREHANKLVEVSLARPISPLPSLPISLLFFSL